MVSHADYVLLGGGVSSVTAAMAIRDRDANGSIAIIRDEDCVPYDRPPLSKGFLKNPEVTLDDISSKFDNFYPDNNIDLVLGQPAIGIDPHSKKVLMADHREIGYGKLLIATGASARRPEVPGVDLPGVHVLRSMADSAGIRAAWPSVNRVVIVGSGYMGLELASAARALDKEVVLVSRDAYPWSSFAGPEIGAFLAGYLAGKGVDCHFGEELRGIDEGFVVRLSNRDVTGDLVILATGVTPNCRLAVEAGLDGDESRGIVVNEFLQTSDPSIYACGDVAYLMDRGLGDSWRAEHHLHAKWTGTAAGANMAGADEAYDKVPYFWTDFFDQHMILRGYPCGSLSSRTFGSASSGVMVDLYAFDDGRLRMGIALNPDEPALDPLSDKLESMIREGRTVDSIEESEILG